VTVRRNPARVGTDLALAHTCSSPPSPSSLPLHTTPPSNVGSELSRPRGLPSKILMKRQLQTEYLTLHISDVQVRRHLQPFTSKILCILHGNSNAIPHRKLRDPQPLVTVASEHHRGRYAFCWLGVEARLQRLSTCADNVRPFAGEASLPDGIRDLRCPGERYGEVCRYGYVRLPHRSSLQGEDASSASLSQEIELKSHPGLRSR
jgi:hypothetical protein